MKIHVATILNRQCRIVFRTLLLLIACAGPMFPQHLSPWTALPKPTSHTLSRIEFTDSLSGWISGQNGVLMRTTDGGMTWSQRLPGAVSEIPDFFLHSPDEVRAIEFRYPVDDTSWYGTVLYHSTDAGTTWDQRRYDSTIFRTIMFQDSMTGFMGGSYGSIVKTTDGGKSWKRVNDTTSHKFPIFKIKFFSPDYGFAVGGQLEIAGIIWKTTDGGESWQSRIVSGDPIFNIHYFDSMHVFCGMGDIDQSGAGFLRSTDAGVSWNFEPTSIWGEPTVFAFRTPTEGWVPMGIAGMCLRTTDEGFTWTEIPVPQQTSVFDLSFPDPAHGFLAGYKGAIFKYNSVISSVSGSNRGPETIRLEQNFPNPFNGSTRVTIVVAEESPIRLVIYDLLGREITTLASGVYPSGSHTFEWNADDSPSGVFLLRLTAGASHFTRKLVLQR